jgi:hypothetical protein
VEAVIEIDVVVFFVPFVPVPFTVMVAMCVAVLQDCPELLVWFMIDSAISFLLFASRMSPDKKMKSTVTVKLSLMSFIWPCVMCESLCVINVTHSVYVKDSLKALFIMKAE